MLKFRCQHCGQRIAVGARHLGKLVTCPECGKPTHPLAEQIVSLHGAPPAAASAVPAAAPLRVASPASSTVIAQQPKNPAKPAAATKSTTAATPATSAELEERCANCGDAIGKLQKRNTWQDYVVCTPCHAKLSGEAASEAAGVSAKTVGKASGRPDDPGAKPLRVAARRLPRDAEAPAVGPLLVRGAATAGRLALAGAWAVGALVKASAPSTALSDSTAPRTPGASDALTKPEPPAATGSTELSVPAEAPRELATVDGRQSPPAGLPLPTRLMIVLAVICLAGAGVYAALTLLRELTGYVTTAAFLLMAVAGGYLLVRLSLLVGRRFFPARPTGSAGPAATTSRDGGE